MDDGALPLGEVPMVVWCRPSLLGYSMSAPIVMIAAFQWWIVHQILANVFLAIED